MGKPNADYECFGKSVCVNNLSELRSFWKVKYCVLISLVPWGCVLHYPNLETNRCQETESM